MKRLAPWATWILFCAVLAWAAFVRLWGLDKRPFWRDEAWVADAVTHSTLKQLLQPADMPLPPLFAVGTKAFYTLTSPPAAPEAGLRLFPALCGIALAALAYAVARTLRAPRTVALAVMAACASSFTLVLWSRELKQYGVEAFLTVAVALLTFRLRRHGRKKYPWLETAILLLLCLCGPWLGYGMIFAAAPLLCLLIFLPPAQGNYARQMHIGYASLAVLAISVFLVLQTTARSQAANPALRTFMSRFFIAPAQLADWKQAATNTAIVTQITCFPYDWSTGMGATTLFALGIWGLALIGLWRWPRGGRREMACWLLLPWLALLAAAFARKYPFGLARMMVFLVPPLVMLAAAGAVAVLRWLAVLTLRRGAPGLWAGLILTLLPVAYMLRVPLHQRYWVNHDFPTALETLARLRQPGELVAVSFEAVPCVRYYWPRSGQSAEGFVYFPIQAGTVPTPENEFDYDALAHDTLRRAGPRWWLLRTNEPLDSGFKWLLKTALERGYQLRVAAQPGGDALFGAAQLIEVTRRE